MFTNPFTMKYYLIYQAKSIRNVDFRRRFSCLFNHKRQPVFTRLPLAEMWESLGASGLPFPVFHLGEIGAVFADIELMLDQLVLHPLHQRRAAVAEVGDQLDGVGD